MGLARYDIYEQRKCFTGMKKQDAKFDIAHNSDIKTCSSIIFHSKLYVYSNKNMSFWPACLGRCGQIKKFCCETLSVLSKLVRTNLYMVDFSSSFMKTFLLAIVVFTQHFYLHKN